MHAALHRLSSAAYAGRLLRCAWCAREFSTAAELTAHPEPGAGQSQSCPAKPTACPGLPAAAVCAADSWPIWHATCQTAVLSTGKPQHCKGSIPLFCDLVRWMPCALHPCKHHFGEVLQALVYVFFQPSQQHLCYGTGPQQFAAASRQVAASQA